VEVAPDDELHTAGALEDAAAGLEELALEDATPALTAAANDSA